MNYTLIFFAILIVVTSVGALFQDKAVDLNRGKKVYDTYCATAIRNNPPPNKKG